MDRTTSARRHRAGDPPGAGIGAILPFVLIGAGVLLAGLSFWTQWSGDELLSRQIEPARSGTATVYTAPTVELDAGEYGLTLSLHDVRVPLSIQGAAVYSVTAPEHPGWSKVGLLKMRERRNSNREDGFVSTVISIPSDGPTTLEIKVDVDFGRDLRLTLRTVQADYRVVLYFGIALAVIGVAMHRPLRDTLLALSRRS